MTLLTTALKVSARCASDLIDLAGVVAFFRSEVHASAAGVRGKSNQAKVPWLGPLRDVLAPALAPTTQVFRRNEDATVVPRSTTGAACEAVEFLLVQRLLFEFVVDLAAFAAGGVLLSSAMGTNELFLQPLELFAR